MQYIGNIIRPPSEANSIILQVTVGCSHNKCTFCGAYKDTSFRIKSTASITADLHFAAQHCKRQRRVFLADGDALILPFEKIKWLLQEIRSQLPWVTKVSLYSNAKGVRSKSDAELKQLKSLGLERVYMGLESGCSEILQTIQKGATPDQMISAAQRIKLTGLFLSVTALLGLGETLLSSRHAKKTADVLNKMSPNQIAILTYMPLPNTLLGEKVEMGEFILPGPQEMLRELQLLVENLSGVRCQFHANHASSYLPLAGRLPRDKDAILAKIAMALRGEIKTTPESWRAL
jgi:radical SAM superfamily enzyme YgiQ (UPF0313 family)